MSATLSYYPWQIQCMLTITDCYVREQNRGKVTRGAGRERRVESCNTKFINSNITLLFAIKCTAEYECVDQM